MRRAITHATWLLPVAFVLLWSSGYIGGTFAVRSGPALTMSLYRFAIGLAIMLVVALVTKAPWPRDPRVWARLVAIGVLLNAVQFTGVYLGMEAGVSAGLTSLIICSAPMIVAVASVPLFGERLSGRKLAGTALGVLGVVIAVGGNLDADHLAGVALVVLGMAGMVSGTLVQAKHGAKVDLRTGLVVQFGAATLVQLPLAAVHGGLVLPVTTESMLSLGWIAVINSLGGMLLFFTLIRRTSSATATSYLYLVPSVTALLGWPLLGQHLTMATVAGLVVSLAGVALFTYRTRRLAGPSGTERVRGRPERLGLRDLEGTVRVVRQDAWKTR